MYKLARTVTLWSSTGVASLGKNGHHLWFLTNNSFSTNATNPPANSIHKVTLDYSFDRAILEWGGKVTAVGDQTACTSCTMNGVVALLPTVIPTVDYLATSVLDLQQGGLAPGDVARGEAGLVLGSAAGSYGMPIVAENNAMSTGTWFVAAPVLAVAAGRTPAAGDISKGYAIVGKRMMATTSGAATGIAGGLDPDISQFAAIHLGVKWLPTWTDGAIPSTTIAGRLLLHLYRKAERTIG